MGDTDKIRRPRRSKESIEQDITNAAIKIIEQEGYGGLNIRRLLTEANADSPVFYNRYKDINDFIDKFVREFDYWLNDSLSINPKDYNPIQNAQKIMTDLIDSLLGNTCMQKLIGWEMYQENYITRRTAQNRDTNSAQIISYFEEEFKDCKINFNIATAILIGGIYYLIIHRKLATFNRVNFDDAENIEKLKYHIRVITEKIFDDYNKEPSVSHTNENEENNKILSVAKKLLENNVDAEIVKASTGLSQEVIISLMPLKKEEAE